MSSTLTPRRQFEQQAMQDRGTALRGKKQLLEKIGVTARTTNTAAQRATPKKAAATWAAKKA
jgi:hypothetical protein